MLKARPSGLAGSILEGGGQILRNAAALAAVLKRPLDIDKIRAGAEERSSLNGPARNWGAASMQTGPQHTHLQNMPLQDTSRSVDAVVVLTCLHQGGCFLQHTAQNAHAYAPAQGPTIPCTSVSPKSYSSPALGQHEDATTVLC